MIRRCTYSSLRGEGPPRIDTRYPIRNGIDMTAGVGAVTSGVGTDSPWRAVAIFVLLTTCLSAIFWALINLTATVTAIYVFALMWMPGLAAILTCRILGRPLSTLGLGRWNGWFVLLAYLIPIAYCLVASVGTVVFGFGGFPNDGFVRTVADTMGLSGIPTWAVIVLFILLQGTTGMVAGVGAAAGEEIGWRGFLVPELARALPFTGVALLSGFIWAAWHYPITAVVYRDADLPPAFWLVTFTFVAIAISFAQAWLRLRTGSLWPPIFLHASHNLWMQSVFFPLTSERQYTKWVAGDLGLAFVVVAAVVAVGFWLKRGDLPVDELSRRAS
jgi:membrane protease YdiL (CAAX protease family)